MNVIRMHSRRRRGSNERGKAMNDECKKRLGEIMAEIDKLEEESRHAYTKPRKKKNEKVIQPIRKNKYESYTPEFREMIVQLYKDGWTLEEITRQYGVARGTINKWRNDLVYGEKAGRYERELDRLWERCQKAEKENDLLREAVAILRKAEHEETRKEGCARDSVAENISGIL